MGGRNKTHNMGVYIKTWFFRSRTACSWLRMHFHIFMCPVRIITIDVTDHSQMADIVIFDPDTISDESTYEEPTKHAKGVKYVIVNGCMVLDNGIMTGCTPGRALRNPY